MAYTVLAHIYKVGFYDVHRYRLQLAYKNCKTCFTNHMGLYYATGY